MKTYSFPLSQMVDICRAHVWSRPTNANPVEIHGYVESLCPYCRDWVVKQVYPNFPKLASIMKLKLFYYGNAAEKKVGNKWKFECQHGPEECRGNMLFVSFSFKLLRYLVVRSVIKLTIEIDQSPDHDIYIYFIILFSCQG